MSSVRPMLLLALLATAAPAQILPERRHDTAGSPMALAAGDLNHDGLTDIVTADIAPAVSALLRDPAGGFLPFTSSPAPTGTHTVGLGHLDGDDELDVVWSHAAFVGAVVGVQLGNGAGGFGPASTTPVAPYPQSLTVSDLDGDGDDDAAAASLTMEVAVILLSDGAGHLLDTGSAPTGDSPSAIRAGDLDGDEDQDLVVANRQSSSVSRLMNAGTGSFSAATPLAGPVDTRELALGDVDEDGDLDLVVGSLQPLAIFLGLGDGNFAPPQSLAEGGSFAALSDVDGDGWQDLVYLGPGGLKALHGSNGPGFGAPPQAAVVPAGVRGLVVLEVDGDGLLDVVLGNNGGRVTVVRGTGFGRFESYEDHHFEQDPTAVLTADLDGDSHLDAAFSSYGYFGAGGVSVAHNDGDGQLLAPVFTFMGTMVDIAAGDVDADADIDLVSADYAGLQLQLADGLGGFAPPTTAPLGPGPTRLDLGDVDGDGDADAVVLAAGVKLLLAGAGSFGAAQDLGPGTVDVVLRDVNLDGRLDVVTLGGGGTLATVLPGDGAGAFLAPLDSALPGPAKDFALGDSNADGRPDLVVHRAVLVPQVAGFLDILPGDGSGHFGPARTLPSDYSLRGLVLDDMNRDGFDEILGTIGAQYASTLLLVNDGAGGYLPPQFHPGGDFPWDLTTGDVSGDGLPDLLVLGSAFESGSLAVLTNLGPEESCVSLGFGKPGLPGVPVLLGKGALHAGQPVSLQLEFARPASAATLIMGSAAAFAPLKGGVLVPVPQFVLGGLVTDGDGALALLAHWPPGVPSGLQLWFQVWIADAAGVGGYAASNGVTATTP